MLEGLVKAIKWYIMALAAVIGTSAFIISNNTGSVNPVIIGVFGYGVVYVMSLFWRELRGKILLISMIVFLGITFASPSVPFLIYILFGSDPYSFNPYYTWGWSMGLFGIPIMTVIFSKLDYD